MGLEKLKDLTCAPEYAVRVSNWFEGLSALEDPVELWDTFKHEFLEAAKECIEGCPRSQDGFASVETLDNIEKSCHSRQARNWDQYRALSRRTRTFFEKRQGEVRQESR